MSEKLERRTEKNYNKWKEYDLLTAIIAIAGLALSVVEFEFSVWMANSIVSTDTFLVDNSTLKYNATGPQNVTGFCNPTFILANVTDDDQGGTFQFCAE